MSENDPFKQPPVTPQPETRRQHDSTPGWILGVVLLVLGLIFLAQNLNLFGNRNLFQNWWAAFIFIPALASLYRFFQEYREAGSLTPSARSALTGGLILTFIALVFLFGLSWSLALPVLLIVVGFSMLLPLIMRQ